jgi:hypothetical protein
MVIDLLVRGEFETVEQLTAGRHLTGSELDQAVRDYGRTLSAPGDGWWDLVEVTPVTRPGPPDLHIAAPLWTHEEGRSDLTLELHLTETTPAAYDIEILNLHVL